jgi:hypothetical protein
MVSAVSGSTVQFFVYSVEIYGMIQKIDIFIQWGIIHVLIECKSESTCAGIDM